VAKGPAWQVQVEVAYFLLETLMAAHIPDFVYHVEAENRNTFPLNVEGQLFLL
jgi:hypothetical protein